jgi:DNA-binding response OmpR family regulator
MSAALESFVGGDLGQDAALRKPFTIEQVLEPIKRLLDQRSDG